MRRGSHEPPDAAQCSPEVSLAGAHEREGITRSTVGVCEPSGALGSRCSSASVRPRHMDTELGQRAVSLGQLRLKRRQSSRSR